MKSPLDLLASRRLPARDFVAKLWKRYALRDVHANDNHQGLDRLYALPDPWGMASAREQSRFEQTNALIAARLGTPASILELGCGEGHQSEHLARLCQRLHGLDVSERAVLRARERLPGSGFSVGDVQSHLASLGGPAEQPPYELVVACEVLYYMSDIDAALQAMSQLGRHCLVTFFCPSARKVAAPLLAMPGLERGWIYHDPYAWLWAWWTPPR